MSVLRVRARMPLVDDEIREAASAVVARDAEEGLEMLVLEGAQAGLSWSTILHKRDGYRRAFAGFDPVKVARFSPAKVERLLARAPTPAAAPAPSKVLRVIA